MRVTQNSVFLGGIVSSVIDGGLAPAAFQRPYVWGPSDVESFFSSILAGLPVGSILTWTPYGAADIDKVSRGRLGPVETSGKEEALLLDGQNRLATFAWAMRAGFGSLPENPAVPYSENEVETWMSGRVLMADFREKAILFSHETDVTSTTIPLAYLIDSGRTMAFLREHEPQSGFEDDALNWWIDGVQTAIRSARVIQTDLERASLEEARTAFLAIAKAGVPMSDEDFDAAIGWDIHPSGISA